MIQEDDIEYIENLKTKPEQFLSKHEPNLIKSSIDGKRILKTTFDTIFNNLFQEGIFTTPIATYFKKCITI